MNRALWIIQIVLALLFLFAGIMKLVMPIDTLTAQTGFSGPFMRFIGVAETAGGLGLVLPGLTGIRPALTPLAAGGLVIVMLGATAVSFATGGVLGGLLPLVVLLLLSFVAYARWQIAPHGDASAPAAMRSAR